MSCCKKMVPLAFLMRYLPNLMCSTPPVFQEVKLTQMDYSKSRCLGPHCQCGLNFETKGTQKVEITIHAGQQGCKKKRCRSSLCQKRLCVPHWSAKRLQANDVRTDLLENWPRYQALPTRMPPPGSGKPNTFRHHLQTQPNSSCSTHPFARVGGRCVCSWSSRCLLPSQLYHDFQKMMQGLSSGYAFIRIFKEEMNLILGPVGVNTGMLDLSSAMALAWDWKRLVVTEPTAEQQGAFWFLFEQLSPFLKFCLWPDPGKCPMKRTHWNLDKDEGIRQYKLLLARVRAVYSGSKHTPVAIRKDARDWSKVTSVGIKPVRTWGILHRVLQLSLQTNGLLCHIVCSKVMEFIGLANAADFPVSQVLWKDLGDVTGLQRYLP